MVLVLLLFTLSMTYMFSLPRFVQGGDTGELVAAAYRLFVPHPPGYPLWIWLEHFWTHLVPIGTVFWRASFMNMLFALAALICVGYPLRKDPLKLMLCLPLLGL